MVDNETKTWVAPRDEPKGARAPRRRRRPPAESAAETVARFEREIPGFSNLTERPSPALAAGELVQAMRKAARLTQAKLSMETGITQGNISDLERGVGKEGPGFRLLSRIADACGLRITFEPKEQAAGSHAAPVFPAAIEWMENALFDALKEQSASARSTHIARLMASLATMALGGSASVAQETGRDLAAMCHGVVALGALRGTESAATHGYTIAGVTALDPSMVAKTHVPSGTVKISRSDGRNVFLSPIAVTEADEELFGASIDWSE